MATYDHAHITDAPRVELHDLLHLTGAEISVNSMPAGAAVPFVHSHQANEEIYIVLEGAAIMDLDGESVELTQGDALRVSPEVKRQMRTTDSAIRYLCIQVAEGSLKDFSGADAVIL